MTDHIPIPPRPKPLSPAAQFMLNAAFHQHQQHDHLNSTPKDLPVPTPLSPVAQKALDAAYVADSHVHHERVSHVIAVDVIRAVADLPNELEIPFNVITDWEAIPGTCARFHAVATWGYNQALETQRTIATELEGQP